MMGDICKCEGKDCPLKDKCFRFQKRSNSYETYFTSIPFDVKKKSCKFFVERQRFKNDK